MRYETNRSFRLRLHRVVALLTVLSAAIPTSAALACGGIFDVKCNLENGGLSPGNIWKQTEKAGQDIGNATQKAGQDVADALNELQASTLTGPALAQAIQASHDTAVNGAMPIPPQIRQQLTGYASEDSMNRVRYKVGDNGFANLAHLIEQGGNTSAVTLIDVIVFRGPTEANDPALWAHELTHVDQYKAWGLHSFAVSYTRQWQSVENAAYDKGNGFWSWRQQSAGIWPQQQAAPPANVGAFCYTPFGRYGPGPVQPLGSPCFITTMQGNVPGQIGL